MLKICDETKLNLSNVLNILSNLNIHKELFIIKKYNEYEVGLF